MRGSQFAPVAIALTGCLLILPEARAGGALGGGFIEFLATGKSGDGQSPLRSAPLPGQAMPPIPLVQRAFAAPQPREPDVGAAVSPHRAIDPKFMRQEVDFHGPQPAGSVIVDTPNRFLYYVLEGGRAMRYGIGVGRPGFEWAGVKTVTRKAEWPEWTPPSEMLLRRPELPKHMAGGPENPLGARAMYLGSTLYRLHGTNEPWTIGQNVSSGCIRLMNEDVMDLYDRVKVGTKVTVI